MAINSEVPAVDVRVIRVRDLDQSEERKQLIKGRKVLAGIASAEASLIGTATVTAAQVLGGFINGVPVAAATYTLPTAALLVAAVPGAVVGDTLIVNLANTSGGVNVITIAAGAGGTLRGNAAVPQNKNAILSVTLTNVTAAAEAYTAYSVVGA